MTETKPAKPGAKGCKGCGRVLYVTDPDYCPDPECQAKAVKEKARDAAKAQRAEEREADADAEKVKRLVDKAVEKGVR